MLYAAQQLFPIESLLACTYNRSIKHIRTSLFVTTGTIPRRNFQQWHRKTYRFITENFSTTDSTLADSRFCFILDPHRSVRFIFRYWYGCADWSLSLIAVVNCTILGYLSKGPSWSVRNYF